MTKGFSPSKIPVNTREELIFGVPAFGHRGSLALGNCNWLAKNIQCCFVIVNLRNGFEGGTKTGIGEGGVRGRCERSMCEHGGRDGVYIATIGEFYSNHP